MLLSLLGLWVWALSGCANPTRDDSDSTVGDGAGRDCAGARAYVFPTAGEGASARLEAAGFEVLPLPLEDSPGQLRGVIYLPAGAALEADYTAYMERYAGDLYEFVDRANLLVQMAQPADAEDSPPFLPTTHGATRGGGPVDRLRVLSPAHRLLMDMPQQDGYLRWQGTDVAPDAFGSWGGFEVLLAEGADARQPVLMEGAYGQGRLLLGALSLSGELGAAGAAFADAFFANLGPHADDICARDVAALRVTPTRATDRFTAGSSMLAVLPDTQVYSLRFPGLFTLQTEWLARNAQAFDIRFVAHLGDLVNNNTPLEWERARDSMALLDGVIPYGMAPGNHDYGPSGDASTRDTLLNDYFSFEQARAGPTFGGAYADGALDNTYHLVSIGGRQLILLFLEWGPRDEVIAWGNDVMGDYPDRQGVLVTHAYLNNNDRRYDHTRRDLPQDFNPHEYSTPGGVNDGEELWQKLVRHHDFILTLNGHVLGDGEGYLASENDLGGTVHQMLSNYQMRPLGGEAYLRLLEFLPDGRTLRVMTYSPLHDDFLRESGHTRDLLLDPVP